MSGRTVVVLGSRIGGAVAARRLHRRLDGPDRVVVVERSPSYVFAPSLLWVTTGPDPAAFPIPLVADHR